jgi:hypothetical protein
MPALIERRPWTQSRIELSLRHAASVGQTDFSEAALQVIQMSQASDGQREERGRWDRCVRFPFPGCRPQGDKWLPEPCTVQLQAAREENRKRSMNSWHSP